MSSRWNISERAATLHADALVWDDHSGFWPYPEADLDKLDRWIASGVDYLSVNVGFDVEDWQKTVKNLAAFRTWFEKHPERFRLVDTAEDIRRAKRAGRLAIAFDIEGMESLDGHAAMVSLYYKLGVRQMLFAYNRNNRAGGGCHDENVGLTPFGRTVIAEMNRVGMLVDLSHCSLKTSLEAMEASSQPVIFSHSNPKALNDHGRNIVDAQIKACGATGGVVGLHGIGLFMGDPEARTETLVRNIAYVAERIGAAHVGIGLDYNCSPGEPVDIRDPHFWPPAAGYGKYRNSRNADPEQLPAVTEGLLAHGFSDSEVRGILGENFFRLASRVWR
ncbi:MAG: membrane dipeptidase [Proteobacteria bacterium]|nr:membrane dipeptidase [Pseudomonadota bacterium]MBI3499445.1 membrane dipeptidase [Pseudomonadota bacterium]